MEKMDKDICSNVLFISNVSKNIKDKELEDLLTPCGSLISANIIYRSDFAYAFAEFDDMRDAAHALRKLNNFLFKGRRLKV